MLSAPPRNASATPRPSTVSGTARTSVAETRASVDPNAPRQSAPSAREGEYPAAARPSARTRKPAPSARAVQESGPWSTPRTVTRSRLTVHHSRCPALGPYAQHHPTHHPPVRAGRCLTHPPPMHDQDPLRQREHFVQVGGVDDHRHAVPGGGAEPLVHLDGGADIQPPGGILRHQHGGPPPEGPGEKHLLLVSARQRSRKRSGTRRADAEAPDDLLGVQAGQRPGPAPPARALRPGRWSRRSPPRRPGRRRGAARAPRRWRGYPAPGWDSPPPARRAAARGPGREAPSAGFRPTA